MFAHGIWCLIVGLFTLSLTASGQPEERLEFDAVILGDSLSTGGGSHPALKFDTENLWQVFNGKISVAPNVGDYGEYFSPLFTPGEVRSPRRLWPTMREFFGGPDWVYRNVLTTLSRAYLDTEEYSWGYLLSTKLGMDVGRLGIAAEDGARVQSISRQLDRVLHATGGRLPPKIFIFYTGNDLCGMEPSLMTATEDFAAHLERGLEYIGRAAMRSGSDQKVSVYVLSFMSMGQLLDSEEILAKKVVAFGQETTCAALRKANYRPHADYQTTVPLEAWYFAMAMPPNPAAFCPTVFQPGKFPEHSVSALANRIRDYREMEKKVIDSVKERGEKIATGPESRLSLHYLTATAGLQFTADEVGEDCFHLSLRGQEKVAKAVVEELTTAPQL